MLWSEGVDRRVRPGRAPSPTSGPPSAPSGPGRARPAPAAGSPPDPAAQAKRLEQRLARMDAGVEDFRLWLADLVRGGLAAARAQPYSYWDTAAARLVDAQLPALAERVREAASQVHARREWAAYLLAEVGRWWTVTCAWQGRERLDADELAEVRVAVGWAAVERGGPRRRRPSRAVDRARRRSAPTTASSSSSAPGSPTTTARWSPCSTSPATARPSPCPQLSGARLDVEVVPLPRVRAAPGALPRPAGGCGAGDRAAGADHPRPTVHAAAADGSAGRRGASCSPPPLADVRIVARGRASWRVSDDTGSVPLADGSAVWTLLAVSGGRARGRLRRAGVGPVPAARRCGSTTGWWACERARPVAGRRRHRRARRHARREPPPRARRPRPRRRRDASAEHRLLASAAVVDALARGGTPLPPAERRGPAARRRGPPAHDQAPPSCCTCCSPSRRSPGRPATSWSWSGCASPTPPASACPWPLLPRCSTSPPAVVAWPGPRRRARRAWALAGGLNEAWADLLDRRDEPPAAGRRPTGSRRGRPCRARRRSRRSPPGAGPTPAAARELLDAQWATVSAKVRADAVPPCGPGSRPTTSRCSSGPSTTGPSQCARRRRGARPAARRAPSPPGWRAAAPARAVKGALVRHLEVDVPDAPDEAAVRDGLTAPAKGVAPAPTTWLAQVVPAHRCPPGPTSPAARSRRP